MKKIIYLLIVTTILWSCGGDGVDVNNIPSVPSITYPTNNLICIENNITFQWSASADSDGDAVTYEVQIATDNSFTSIVYTVSPTTTSFNYTLDKGVTYYWRIRALDSEGASSYSPVYSFYTEGEGVSNHLPDSPELVAPTLNEAVSVSPTLQWAANDDDNDDLTFDVFLKETNNIDVANDTPISSNQSATSFSPSTALTASTQYYWKIVVKDDNGGENIGLTWYFVTN